MLLCLQISSEFLLHLEVSILNAQLRTEENPIKTIISD